MSCSSLKELCLLANKTIIDNGLAKFQFGNVSLRNDHEVIIKPTGIDLDTCDFEDMSVVDVRTAQHSSGRAPSTDTLTHIEIYKKYKEIQSVVHTHSPYATAWAQASKPIPCLGTTHADYWEGEVPVTRELTESEINGEYELATGKVIVEMLLKLGLEPCECPGILVAHHGPFTWGQTVEEAVKNAELLEYIAKLACLSLQLNPITTAIPVALHHRHFSRKHGTNAYYGQENS